MSPAIGVRFGRLVVVSHVDRGRVVCRCDCGAERVVWRSNLASGKSRSCGCAPHNIKTHRLSKTAENRIWSGLINRCTNPNNHSYPRYGGRGISVAPEWRGPGGFERFLEHIGPRPSAKHSVDRIDNDRGYEPGNVRWATASRQGRNRRSARMITAFGRTQCLSDWIDESDVPAGTIHHRLRMGWDAEAAFTAPRTPRTKLGEVGRMMRERRERKAS